MTTTATEQTTACRKVSEVKAALDMHDGVARSKEWGTWKATQQYFYHGGRSAEKVAAKVRAAYSEAVIVETFDSQVLVGRSGLAKLGVEFVFPDEVSVEQVMAKIVACRAAEQDANEKRWSGYWQNQGMNYADANRMAGNYSRTWTGAYGKLARAERIYNALIAAQEAK